MTDCEPLPITSANGSSIPQAERETGMTSTTIDLDQLYDDFSKLRGVFKSRPHKHSDYQEPALLSTLAPPASTDKPQVTTLCRKAHGVVLLIRDRLNNGLIEALNCPETTRDILERLWSFVELELWPMFSDPSMAADRFMGITDDDSSTLWLFQTLSDNLDHYAQELGTLIAQTSGDRVPEYLGNGEIRIPGEPELIKIDTPTYVRILEFLIEKRRVVTKEFTDANIGNNPSNEVRRLLKKHPKLKPYITRPGQGNKGKGYSTVIKDARQ